MNTKAKNLALENAEEREQGCHCGRPARFCYWRGFTARVYQCDKCHHITDMYSGRTESDDYQG